MDKDWKHALQIAGFYAGDLGGPENKRYVTIWYSSIILIIRCDLNVCCVVLRSKYYGSGTGEVFGGRISD